MKEIEEVKKKIFQENKKSLRISRVPGDIKERFIALANKEFAGDYGMTLKWLMMERWDKLLDHEIRITQLEGKINGDKETKEVKTLSGKVIKIKR